MRTHRDRVPSGAMVLGVLIVALCAGFHESWAIERSWTATTWLKDGQVHMLGDLNGELYFVSQFQLWKTNGTPAGTVTLPGPSPLVSFQPSFCPASFPFFARAGTANGLIFFSASDASHGQELWKTDGTAAGTQLVKDLLPAGDSLPRNFVPVDGAVHFRTQTPCCGEWRSDGTDPGTSYLSDQTAPIGTLGGFYFFARDGELWRSDGSGPGTTFLADIDPGGTTGGATFLAKQAGKLYFVATAGPSLWVTDGTPGGTLPLLATIGFFSPAMTCDATVCYFVENPSSGVALWRTDGTVLGTTKLEDIVDSNASQPILVNGIAYFKTIHEVWRTDGTPAGTEAIFSDPDQFVSALLATADGKLFFILAATDDLPSALWTSDGTVPGTRHVADLGTSLNLPEVVALDRSLVLGVWGAVLVDGTFSIDEWRLQKFDPATEQLITLADAARSVNHCPTPTCSCNSARPAQLAVVGDKWYFEALDPASSTPRLGVTSNVYFRDVLPDHWAFRWVEGLADAGLTSGCGVNTYCPEAPVSRAEMAVLLLRGIHGPDHVPPAATGQVFADVAADFWAAGWIEEAAAEGLTGGCGGNPLLYCPGTSVTRGQMAVLLLRAKHGAAYQPPPATGLFADVPTSDPFAPWIEQLALEGITSGCASGPLRYCPAQPVTRAQMAVFLTRTFALD